MIIGDNDMDDLKEGLIEFKELTEKLIGNLKEEQFDNVENFFNKRQKIIKQLSEINYSKEEFIQLSKELNIMELDNTLGKLINEKQTEIKEELTKIKTQKKANKQYNKGFYNNSNVLSKKI